MIDNPISIVLFGKCFYLSFCLNVPDFCLFILRITYQKSSFFIEHYTWYVIFMTSKSSVLPSNFICVFPKFYFPVIRSWSNNILSWVETNPINSSFVSFENFNALNFDSNKWRKIFRLSKFLFKNSIIPKSDSGIKRSWYYKIFIWMKLSTHYIMTMTSNYINTSSALIIPDSDGLIVAGS